LSVLDNLQRILNSRAGTLSHLPDYGLPDMGVILQGLPATAHGLMQIMVDTLLKYEPRLAAVSIELLPQTRPGHLEYALDVQLKGGRRAIFGTTVAPEGNVVVRHLKRLATRD
jgi:type VI secretion system protein